eukprot:jgi/Tetstr1/432088/TSEL_021559.t1
MASWAAIASKDAEASPIQTINWKEDKPATAVVDANAIISGLRLPGGVQRAVTIQDVMGEIRDKKSREWLQRLPYKLEIMDPSEDSIKAVTAFARMTGDLRNLSKPDIHLLALAHDLETRVYGDGHLRKEPQKARIVPKNRSRAKPLPGWGTEGGDWAELDELEGLSSETAAVSKVAAELTELRVADEDCAITGADGEQHGASAGMGNAEGDNCLGEEDDSGWEVATKTNTARRHKVQKEAKRAQRDEIIQMTQPADEDGKEEEEEEEGEAEGEGGEDGDSDEGESEDGTDDDLLEESCISSITADFAMQNVLLQMGLRLVTPDGRRIREVNCWVLRCSACRATTREMQKLFCPQCGNATMDKVELTIGPDGQEQYGVRKKHNLRGTRYSLPKPKGGKKSVDPVLREDVMMAKMSRRRPKKAAATEDHGWMTEFGGPQQQHGSVALQQGLAPLINSWKNNPNERAHRGSNRRRK